MRRGQGGGARRDDRSQQGDRDVRAGLAVVDSSSGGAAVKEGEATRSHRGQEAGHQEGAGDHQQAPPNREVRCTAEADAAEALSDGSGAEPEPQQRQPNPSPA